MSDKITKVRIKQADGTFSTAIPIGVEGANVSLSSGVTLQDTISSINTKLGNEDISDVGTNVTNAINLLKTDVTSKINTVDIINDLTHSDTNKPLSAAQGKALNDSKINTVDVVNNLTSTATNKPLSAAQGKALNDALTFTVTNNILATASADTTMTTQYYYGSGSAYTGSLLKNSQAYGTFVVFKRSGGNKFVVSIDQGGGIYTNAYNGSTWNGWHETSISPTKLTVTVNSNVTAPRANFFQFGNVISYSLTFTTTSQLSSGTNFFSLPSGYNVTTTQDIPIITKTGGVATLYTSGRNLVANGAVPAGTYYANGVIVVS